MKELAKNDHIIPWDALIVHGGVSHDVESGVITDDGTDATVSGQFRISDGTANNPSIVYTSEDDGTGTGYFLVGAANPGVSVNGVLVFDLEDTNVAGAGANLATISAALGIFDGSDTFNGLSIELTNANHTGSSNVVNAVNIASITGDADASESAIFIGTGFDQAIAFTETTQLISSDATGISIRSTDSDGFVLIDGGATSGLTQATLQVFENQTEEEASEEEDR